LNSTVQQLIIIKKAAPSIYDLFAKAIYYNQSDITEKLPKNKTLNKSGLLFTSQSDAEIGRFIQADDYLEPEATQGLNRYSYVLTKDHLSRWACCDVAATYASSK
jgi:hypothetical protein